MVAIAITAEFHLAPLLQDVVLAVVVATLVVQGLTLEPVLARALRSPPAQDAPSDG